MTSRLYDTLGVNAFGTTNSLADPAGSYATRARDAALGIDAFSKTNSLADLAGSYSASRLARDAALGIDAFGKTNSLADLAGSYSASRLARDAALGIDAFSKTNSLADLAGPYSASRLARDAALGINALDQGLARERNEWERLGRTTIPTRPQHDNVPILVEVPDLVDDFTEALEVQARRSREANAAQVVALAEIVEAGKAQNALMAEIVGLQKLLVKEALENSRIQRVVLYFTGLGAALAIFALLK